MKGITMETELRCNARRLKEAILIPLNPHPGAKRKTPYSIRQDREKEQQAEFAREQSQESVFTRQIDGIVDVDN